MEERYSGKQKRHLKSLCNRLEDAVVIGHQGLSDNVIKEVELALLRQELIKVRLANALPIERHEFAQQMSTQFNAFLVQVFGRTVCLYRAHPDRPVIRLPQD